MDYYEINNKNLNKMLSISTCKYIAFIQNVEITVFNISPN